MRAVDVTVVRTADVMSVQCTIPSNVVGTNTIPALVFVVKLS
jgi:hypothetical protein